MYVVLKVVIKSSFLTSETRSCSLCLIALATTSVTNKATASCQKQDTIIRIQL